MYRPLLIAGGGTGGHLFPGIAVAQEMRRRFPALRIVFACTNRDLDKAELSRYGFDAVALDTPRWPGLGLGLVSFCRALAATSRDAMRAVRNLRPAVVAGLGGYGCAPPLYAAWRQGIPSVILEQNVMPGRATRVLAPIVSSVCCQWAESFPQLNSTLGLRLRQLLGQKAVAQASCLPSRNVDSLLYLLPRGTGRYTKNWLVHTGNPIRTELSRLPVGVARKMLGLERAGRVLLVLGGSQGSTKIDALAPAAASILTRILPNLGVIHLANQSNRDKVENAYRNAGVTAAVYGFFRDMRLAYSAADAALCRAGGTSIAELAAYGIPMVLIPYPHAADDHQRANARAVEVAGAGYVADESGLDAALLGRLVAGILADLDRLALMSARARALGRPEAAGAVADILVELAELT